MKNLGLTDLLNTELGQFPLQSPQFLDCLTPHLLAVHEVPDTDPEELLRHLVGYDDLGDWTEGYRLIKDTESNAELELRPDPLSILEMKTWPDSTVSVVFGYLGAAEEVSLVLLKLVRLLLPATLPAVTLHHPVRLHVLDETEQPIFPCNKEIFSITS